MVLVERTKLLDSLYITFGVKYHHLQKCVWHYKLDEDKDIQVLKKSYEQQRRAKSDDI